MSYCRFGKDSDVYCYHSANCGGFFTMTPDDTYHDKSPLQTAARLELLREQGFLVPKSAVQRLINESLQEMDNKRIWK
jgi:hypothetical protein